MALRILIVTAADEAYLPLLDGLLRSLEDCGLPIACFDVGLHATSRYMVAQRAQIIEPIWDLLVNESTISPAHRASTARPFVPRYFPGYDIYLWIDADAWVQIPLTLNSYITYATNGPIVAATHSHPAYAPSPGILSWRKRRMSTYFGSAAADQFPWENYFNSGVFALRADAPHWKCWADAYAIGLRNAEGAFCCDQTALNYAIWQAGLVACPLPALCNWLCHLALPVFDPVRRRFCEPTAPENEIGILHLAGKTKTRFDLHYPMSGIGSSGFPQ